MSSPSKVRWMNLLIYHGWVCEGFRKYSTNKHKERPHKSVSYSPAKIIQPHLFNIFTLKHDIRTFVEKLSRVAFTHFYGPNRSGCLDWGVGGGQPNLGNAWILGTSGRSTHPLEVKTKLPTLQRKLAFYNLPMFTLRVF